MNYLKDIFYMYKNLFLQLSLLVFFLFPTILFSQRGVDDSYLDKMTNEEKYLPLCSGNNDQIVDLVVLTHGGNNRLQYTKEQLIPYVYKYNTNGDFEWLFDGFLFQEDRTNIGGGHAFEQKVYLHQKDRARKTEWEWLLNRIFTLGESIDALNSLIEDLGKVESLPARRRKVILSIPEPLSGQLDWGSLNGKELDFANDSNRMEAVRWYIDELIQRFNAGGYQNLDLSGFYWLREDNELSFHLMPLISSYIKSKGYKLYWRPSYGRFRGNSWKTNKFDVAYLKPDHLTTSWFEKKNVERACTYASRYNMGLEIDLDKLVRQYANYRTKFNEYMEVYTDKNVFAKAAMSYQDGDAILYELSQSKNQTLNKIYAQVVDSVAARQRRADKLCARNTSVPDFEASDNIVAYYSRKKNKVIVDSAYPLLKVSVYNINGVKLIEENYDKNLKILATSLVIPNFKKGFCIVSIITDDNHNFNKKIFID